MGCKAVGASGKSRKSVGGFTLTMWDVKEPVPTSVLGFAAGFYLNYVGCKGFIWKNVLRHNNRFTLTMWDVKSTKRVVALFKFSVLP